MADKFPPATHTLVYGDGGSSHQLNHIINGEQIFSGQNEDTINLIIQIIRMDTKPKIGDHPLRRGVPLGWIIK